MGAMADMLNDGTPRVIILETSTEQIEAPSR